VWLVVPLGNAWCGWLAAFGGELGALAQQHSLFPSNPQRNPLLIHNDLVVGWLLGPICGATNSDGGWHGASVWQDRLLSEPFLGVEYLGDCVNVKAAWLVPRPESVC